MICYKHQHIFRFHFFLLIVFVCNVLNACTLVKPVPQPKDTLNNTADDTTGTVVYSLDTSELGPFNFPIDGKVISHYGYRGRRMHTGTDIKLKHGDPVHAAFTGVVTKASVYYGYGILVVLKHPGNLETYYAHLSKALVKEGDVVHVGSPVGLGGRTGRATTDHLHFEIRSGGKAMNAENFFDFDNQVVKTLKFEKRRESAPASKPVKVSKSSKKAKTKSKDVERSADTEIKYHSVKKGETLYAISKKYGTTVDHLCKLNKLKKSSVLKVGRKLRVN
jgi:murein DD-endopeptidase MepM/ murein hydrolase activator NlpD